VIKLCTGFVSVITCLRGVKDAMTCGRDVEDVITYWRDGTGQDAIALCSVRDDEIGCQSDMRLIGCQSDVRFDSFVK
jgi:hypothetical protein